MINTDQNQLPGDNSADIPSIIYRKAFTLESAYQLLVGVIKLHHEITKTNLELDYDCVN